MISIIEISGVDGDKSFKLALITKRSNDDKLVKSILITKRSKHDKSVNPVLITKKSNGIITLSIVKKANLISWLNTYSINFQSDNHFILSPSYENLDFSALLSKRIL